jgi:hypothetical protein
MLGQIGSPHTWDFGAGIPFTGQVEFDLFATVLLVMGMIAAFFAAIYSIFQ